MGIPKYHKWLTTRYPEAFAEAQQENADHVYVDVNALLHDCMRWATNEDEFFQKLFFKFDQLFRVVRPTKSVFLAVDGPASCAKCLTQRKRRREHLHKDTSKKHSKGKGKAGGESKMSNNMLTPGVPLMGKVTTALEYYGATRMAPNGCFCRCESVTVSGAQAVGEGEHKIISQMLRNAACVANESHVIISGDADIFLLSVVQNVCRRVRVVSERPDDGFGGNKRKRGGVMLQVWDAEKLAKRIAGELKKGPGVAVDEKLLRRDFALVSLLAGNDYLPELKCTFDTQELWNKYLGMRRTKYSSDSLIECTATEDGLPLSHLPGGWALDVGENGSAFAVEPYEHFAYNIAFLAEFMATAAASPVSAGSQIPDKAAEGIRKYLEGLLWVLEMYHHGYCADFYFVMEKSHFTHANAKTAAVFLSSLDAEGGSLTPSRSEVAPMRPLACALCILPVQHAEQFLSPGAPALKPLFANDHPLLGSINSLERSADLKEFKVKVAALQKEMMSLRSLGRDDSAVKAQLTLFQQRMEACKKNGGDVDVVPLWEINDEVVQLNDGKNVSTLDFASDVTILREQGSEQLILQPPARGMPPARCNGMSYRTGEYPQVDVEAPCSIQNGDACEEEDLVEVGEEQLVEEEALEEEVEPQEEEADDDLVEVCEDGGVEQDTVCLPGESVEGYWPDDDTWLPATIHKKLGNKYLISWDEDGSQSVVNDDYVRKLSQDEPPAKRIKIIKINK